MIRREFGFEISASFGPKGANKCEFILEQTGVGRIIFWVESRRDAREMN